MATEGKTTALALAGDMSIPTVLSAIDTQIKSLKGVETSKFKTNMKLAPFGDLKQVKDVPTLIKAFSMVESKELAYERSVKNLGVDNAPKFAEDGSSVDQWKHDIKLQIDIITHKDRLEELKTLKAEAEKFLSAEDQKAIFFEKMIKSVSALGLGSAE